MAKQKSMMDYMKSRASIGAPKGNLGGEPDTKYSDSEIKGKKLEAKPTSISQPSSSKPNLQKTLENPKFVKQKAELEKKIKRKESLKNLGKWALGTAGTAAGLVGGYYGLTKEAGGKPIKDASGRQTGTTPKYRRWLWEKE